MSNVISKKTEVRIVRSPHDLVLSEREHLTYENGEEHWERITQYPLDLKQLKQLAKDIDYWLSDTPRSLNEKNCFFVGVYNEQDNKFHTKEK